MAEAEHAHDPLAPGHLFGHVQDAEYFEVPRFIHPAGHIEIPQPFRLEEPIFGFDLVITKFMIIEVVVATLLVIFFVIVANRAAGGGRPRGRFWNMLEAFLVYLRDEVARPAIGKHDGDKYLPFLWTMFFFILACNLFGMIPWTGTATAALATTGALALVTFSVVAGSGIKKLGPLGYLKAQVPHMDVPKPMGYFLVPMVFVIEVVGLLIKHFVLAMRLLSNMVAGHLVLAVLVAFIAVTWNNVAWYGVMPASVLGATALSLLELLVAFIQAYVFTFLSALFIGMAIHPH